MGNNNKIPFNATQIKNGMIVKLRKDGRVKAAWDRETGEPINVDKDGKRI